MPNNTSDLVDRIYEAAVVAELWPEILKDIAARVGGTGGALFDIRPEGMRWVGCQMMSDLLADFAELNRPELNIRTPLCLASKHPGFITDLDILTEEQCDTHPFYTEFLRPRGVGWCAGTPIRTPSGDMLCYSFERHYSGGPFNPGSVQQLDELRPHLARAAVLSGRLALERARAAAEMLGLLGLPGAVLSLSHRITIANSLFEELIPDIVRDRRDRVTLTEAGADALLASAISVNDGRHVRSIPIPASEERPPMIVHLVPVRLAARDVFSSASDVMIITPVSRAEVPSADIIQGLFDLTPAEARVARGIAEGSTVRGLATSSGLSSGTVRSQLKSVFLKTGMSRQAELVSFLGGMRLPGGRDGEQLPKDLH